MRFRRLTKNELEHLEEDFVRFLASNQITSDDWEKFKTEQPEKVHELLDIFSDIVLEKVFKKLRYLQHRSKDTIRVFFCQEDSITMTGLQISGSTKDLTKSEDLALLANPQQLDGKVKLFQMEKEYTKEREDEIFDMLTKSNCKPTSEEMYQMLLNMHQQS